MAAFQPSTEGHVRDDVPAVVFFDEQCRQGRQGDWLGLLEKSVDSVLEYVLRSWPPVERSQLAEDADEG